MSDFEEETKTINNNNNNNNNHNDKMIKLENDISDLKTMFAQLMQHTLGQTTVKTEMGTTPTFSVATANPSSSFSSSVPSSSFSSVTTSPVATATTISPTQAITNAISHSAATSSFTSRAPTRMVGVKSIASIITPTSFKSFRDDFLQVVLEHGLDIYIDNTYEQVCLHVQQHNPNVAKASIDLFVKTQSSSMTAVLQKGLGAHWARHNDKMLAAAALPENENLFIKNNIHWVWNDVLKTHQTVSKFNKVNLLASLFQIRHNMNDNPTVTLEKVMKIKRQLELHKHTVDDSTLAAVLFYSMPKEMETVKQLLTESDYDTIEHVFNAMKRYYDAKINQPGSNNNNHNNSNQSSKISDGTTTAFIYSSNTGDKICFQFKEEGKCKNGKKCPYLHENKNGKKPNKNSGSQNSKTHHPKSNHKEKQTPVATATADDTSSELVFTFVELFAANTKVDSTSYLQVDRKTELVYDSGASAHICCNQDYLTDKENINPVPMIGVHDKITHINKLGCLKINERVTLTNVFYVPNATTNLISASRLLDKGLKIDTSPSKITVSTPSGTVIFTFKRKGGIFVMDLPSKLVNYDENDDDDRGYKLSPVATASRNIINKKGAIRFKPSLTAPASPSSSSSSTSSSSSSSSSASNVSASTIARNALTSARPAQTQTLNKNKNSTIVHAKCFYEIPVATAISTLSFSSLIAADPAIVQMSNQSSQVATSEDALEQVLTYVSSDTLHARLGHYGQHDQCPTCIQSKGRKTKSSSTTTRTPAKTVFERLHMDLVGPMSTVIDSKIVPCPTLAGKRYALIIVDEKSRFTFTFLLKNKSDAKIEIIGLINLIKNQFDISVKAIHSDRGGEFLNEMLETFFISKGIIHTTTTAETPHLNGLAERTNGILVNTGRGMLIHAKAPILLWGEVLIAANYLHNRTPLPSLDKNTPYELVYKVKPPLDHLRVWGCDTFIYNNKRGKFDPIKIPGIFIGYSEQQHAYRILLSDGRVKISRDVSFIETSFRFMKLYHLFITNNESGTLDEAYSPSFYVTNDENSNQSVHTPLLSINSEISVATAMDSMIENDNDNESNNAVATSKVTTSNKIHYSENDISFDIDQPQEHSDQEQSDFESEYESDDENISSIVSEVENDDDEPVEYSSDSDSKTNSYITAEDLTPVIAPSVTGKRIRHAPGFYNTVSTDNYYQEINLFKFDDLSLLRPQQMLKRKDAHQFQVATDTEANSLIEQKVGIAVTTADLPSGIKPIKIRPLYTIKYDDQNKPIKHKVRFVAQGFNQKEGIDYTETFAPTAKSKSIKLILSDAAKNNKELKQFDVVTAFLNAKLTETVYVQFSDGCGILSGKIWKLSKALYGLKQSPYEWNSEMNATLTSLGYVATKSDPCIYVKHVGKEVIILFLYVDDAVISYDKSIESIWLKDFNLIKSKYDIKDLGDCEWILNMKVVRDRITGTILLSQQAYVQQILINNGLDINTVRTVDNPCDPSLTTVVTHTELLDEKQHATFRSLIGAFSWLAQMTRIDIAYAVNSLSRHLATPTMQHLNAAKRLLRYLAGTSHYSMIFKNAVATADEQLKTHQHCITAYTDASWANDLTNRKSTSGTVIKCNGNTICWSVRRQKSVALSSTEAEYYALVITICEALWVKQWMSEVFNIHQPILVLCDNQSAIALTSHDSLHQRSKHIDIKYHFIRDHIKQQSIIVKWLPTAKQEADILTKAMVTKQFQVLVSKNLSV